MLGGGRQCVFWMDGRGSSYKYGNFVNRVTASEVSPSFSKATPFSQFADVSAAQLTVRSAPSIHYNDRRWRFDLCQHTRIFIGGNYLTNLSRNRAAREKLFFDVRRQRRFPVFIPSPGAITGLSIDGFRNRP